MDILYSYLGVISYCICGTGIIYLCNKEDCLYHLNNDNNIKYARIPTANNMDRLEVTIRDQPRIESKIEKNEILHNSKYNSKYNKTYKKTDDIELNYQMV